MSAQLDPKDFSRMLNEFQLSELFLVKLGWDHPRHPQYVVHAGENTYTLSALAQKREVAVFLCTPDAAGKIPSRQEQLKIEREVTKQVYEHLLVFSDAAQTTLAWLWVSRAPNQPTSTRTHTWTKGTETESLRQKLENIVWSLSEEEAITLSTVTTGLKRAFDRDKVTKKFYDRFKAEHRKFLDHIEGIQEPTDKLLYASLMLNRLMFIYFIQKKGFLDNDSNYLANRLSEVRDTAGKDQFYSFYRKFLKRLFHEGLGQPKDSRVPTLYDLIGNVPYLNGGLFEPHKIEVENPDIGIRDAAFDDLFRFFESYDWLLDDRPLRHSNEINPDVLGYIFEKYVNQKEKEGQKGKGAQKEKGAYYTKEDITEYIGKSTIIPYLMDRIAEHCPDMFAGNNSVWRLLQDSPKSYLYDAMTVGVFDRQGKLVPLSDLPAHVQESLAEPRVCDHGRLHADGEAIFHTVTGERGTLPTETWHEYLDRRSRCLENSSALASGKITSLEDMITRNLNLRQFMQDIIETCDDARMLHVIWKTLFGEVSQTLDKDLLHGITILDPTCGSGAFLFAAANILEPLYEACIDRMEDFAMKAEESNSAIAQDFLNIITEMNNHPSRRYFVFKCIILRNLFGVDIMAEAAEICKLRLFLKLVSQVDYAEQLEPLPDIDFNIRSGNALIGFATEKEFANMKKLLNYQKKKIQQEMSRLAKAFNRFRDQQLHSATGLDATLKQSKAMLLNGLAELGLELDHYLAQELGIEAVDDLESGNWKERLQPFHWLSEYYSVMQNGGFDVVIGNPPYVGFPAENADMYSRLGYTTTRSLDIYALCLERAGTICSKNARCGMIVPLSLTFGEDFAVLRDYVYAAFRQNWFSSFSKRPSLLFEGAQVRCTIHLASRTGSHPCYHTTKLHRWHSAARESLFETIFYSKYTPKTWGRIPKLNGDRLIDKFESHLKSTYRVGSVFSGVPSKFRMHYKNTGGNWLSFGHRVPSTGDSQEKPVPHGGFGACYFSDDRMRKITTCLLNGKIAFLYWNAIGDDFHVTKKSFFALPFDLSSLSEVDTDRLIALSDKLEERLEESIGGMKMRGREWKNFNLLLCRDITDESDAIFARAFHLDQVWDEIELLYSHIVKPGVKDV